MKLKFLLFACIIITISSCGTDDEPPFVLATDGISGIYDVVALSTTDIETFTTQDGVATTNTYTSVGSNFNTTWTFADNNTFTLTGSFTNTYTDDEDGVTTTESDLELLDEFGDYSLNAFDQTLLLDFDGDTLLYDIIAADGQNIILRANEIFNSQGFSSDFTVDIALTRK